MPDLLDSFRGKLTYTKYCLFESPKQTPSLHHHSFKGTRKRKMQVSISLDNTGKCWFAFCLMETIWADSRCQLWQQFRVLGVWSSESLQGLGESINPITVSWPSMALRGSGGPQLLREGVGVGGWLTLDVSGVMAAGSSLWKAKGHRSFAAPHINSVKVWSVLTMGIFCISQLFLGNRSSCA